MSCVGKLISKNYAGYPIGLSHNSNYTFGKIIKVYNDMQVAVDNFLTFDFKACCECDDIQKTMVNNEKTVHFIIDESEKQGYLAIDVHELNKLSHCRGSSAFLLSNKSCYSQIIVFFTSENGIAEFNNIVLRNAGDHVTFTLNSGHGLFFGKNFVLYV
jgi:hypothetical protein